MKGKSYWFILPFSILVFSFSISYANNSKIAIPGSGDGVAILESIAKAFEEKKNVEVRIPKSIGSGGAIKVVGEEKAIVGRVGREIKESEKHYGLEYTSVFELPIAIYVNKSVSLQTLSEQQVVDIFSGKITNWKDVGGADKPITVIKRQENEAALGQLKKTFPGFRDLKFVENATLAEKTFIMVAQVANRPDSIGFGPLDSAMINNNIKTIAISGKKPTDRDYPYCSTIGFVYKKNKLSQEYKDFMDYACSEEAHEAIAKAGGKPLR